LTYLLAFAASFAFIFLKAFQQLNVVHRQYVLVIPTSMMMSACEVAVIYLVAKQGWGWLVLATGLGGGLGCVGAMFLHKFTQKRPTNG
jgi:hypothetical protein